MNPVLTKYPVDLTGRNSNNLVSGEEHLVLRYADVQYPVFALDHGGFYTQGLAVFDKDLNELVPNHDYIATYAYADASRRVGMEILGAIVILNPLVTDSVYVSAQMVGGDFAFSLTELEDTLAYLRTLGNTVPTWGGYVGVQPLWIDGALSHKRWELPGYQPFNIELEAIAKAIMAGDQEAMMEYRNNAKALHDAFVAQFDNRLALHLADHDDPHNVTATQVGLGAVIDLPLATDAEVAAGISNGHYVTPYHTKAMVQTLALDPLNTHKGRTDNPHGLTPPQAGTYWWYDVDAIAATKLPINGTADNANGILSNMETFATVAARWQRIARSSSNAINAGLNRYSDVAIPAELLAWSINPAANSVANTTNSSGMVGFVSPEKFDNYVLESILKSTNSDNDFIGLCIAHAMDDLGQTHTLTVMRALNGAAPMMITKDFMVDITDWNSIQTPPGTTTTSKYNRNVRNGLKWANGVEAVAPSGASGLPGWLSQPQGCRLKVTRAGDFVTIETSQLGESAYFAPATTVIDLSADPALWVFRGAQSFGYVAQSQALSTWEVLQRPGDLKSWGGAVDLARSSLDTSFFTTGLMNPAMLGGGDANWETMLLGNGQWTTISSVFSEFGSKPTGAVYWGGTYASEAAAVSNIAAAYGYGPTYPVGTIVFFRFSRQYTVGHGNGAGEYWLTVMGAAVRTPSGWTQL
jgi:hypothetical protein